MLRRFLVIALKNAVNAVLITVPPMIWDSGHFTVHDWTGLKHILLLAGSAVLSREAIVWGPIILKWTTSGADPNA